VVETLLEAQAGSVGVLEAVHAEAERWVATQHLVEELTALFDLQVVGLVEGSLVYVGSNIGLQIAVMLLIWFFLLRC
jgi:hypothetical protein